MAKVGRVWGHTLSRFTSCIRKIVSGAKSALFGDPTRPRRVVADLICVDDCMGVARAKVRVGACIPSQHPTAQEGLRTCVSPRH